MPERVAYGGDREQFAELTLPDPRPDAPVAVVALFHGGSFETRYTLDQMRAMAADLAARGLAAYNVELRRLGSGGEGRALFDDARAAVDHLASVRDAGAPLDLDRVAVVGLSSGAAPAFVVAARPGSVAPCAAVNQAGLVALGAIARERPDSSPARLLGGSPDAVPDVYAAVDPMALLPIGVPLLHVHGADDDIVPLAVARAFDAAARAAGDESEVAVVPGDHFVHKDATSPAWRTAADWLERRLAR